MKCVGREPIEDVVMMEYHNEAYDAWKSRGVKDRILVHIDGHIDFGWIADEDPKKLTGVNDRNELAHLLDRKYLWNFSGESHNKINIANYIYPSMRDGIVRELYWVVPDPVWKKWRQRRAAKNIIKHIASLAPARSGIVESIYVMPLSSLPRFDEPVLLDIDTDYFVTYSITAPAPYFCAKPVEPWIWPDEFLVRLAENKIKSDLVTIAYSVEGGYTPIEWRFLGDEIASLVRSPCLLGEPGKKRTPETNVSYKTRYANKGLKYFAMGRLNAAAVEYSNALLKDPLDAGSITGLGEVLLRRKNYAAAKEKFGRAIEIQKDNVVAHYGLGCALSGMRKFDEAALSFEKAVEIDPLFTAAHHELGHAYAETGKTEEAISEYKIARNGGLDGPHVRFALARLYLKKGNFYKARGEFWRALWFVNKLGPSYLLQGLLSASRIIVRRKDVYQKRKHFMERSG